MGEGGRALAISKLKGLLSDLPCVWGRICICGVYFTMELSNSPLPPLCLFLRVSPWRSCLSSTSAVPTTRPGRTISVTFASQPCSTCLVGSCHRPRTATTTSGSLSRTITWPTSAPTSRRPLNSSVSTGLEHALLVNQRRFCPDFDPVFPSRPYYFIIRGEKALDELVCAWCVCRTIDPCKLRAQRRGATSSQGITQASYTTV